MRANAGWLLPTVVMVFVVGCRPSPKDEAADLALLCEAPRGEDGTAIFLRSFPAAAGYEILDERLKTRRWKNWIAGVDKKISTKTRDAPGAQRMADDLDAAGKAAGHPSCWAAAAVRRWLETHP